MEIQEAFRTNRFVLEINGIESPGATRISGLTDGEIDVIEQADAGSNIIYKISSGVVKFGDVTIERNCDGSSADGAFKDWFQEMFATDGPARGSSARRNGSIVVYSAAEEEQMRFGFEGAWVKSSSFSDLEAGSANLLKQTVVLSVDRLYRP